MRFLIASSCAARRSQRIARPNAGFLYLTNFNSHTSTGKYGSVASSSLSLISLPGNLPGTFAGIGTEHGETNFAERG
jgi:hypothetical protein